MQHGENKNVYIEINPLWVGDISMHYTEGIMSQQIILVCSLSMWTKDNNCAQGQLTINVR